MFLQRSLLKCNLVSYTFSRYGSHRNMSHSPTSNEDTKDILCDVDERGVAYVTLNQPRRANALSTELLGLLIDCLKDLSRDEALRAMVLTGRRHFAAGSDITQLNRLADPHAAGARIRYVSSACRSVRDVPVPVICRAQGACVGAGLIVAVSCDFRLAEASAKFGMPEVRLGVPSSVETAILPRLIGWGHARQLVFTGETISASTALEWGLLEKVTENAEQLGKVVEANVQHILSAGPRAIRLQKELFRQWESTSMDDGINAGPRVYERAYESDEPRRMTGQMLKKLEERKK